MPVFFFNPLLTLSLLLACGEKTDGAGTDGGGSDGGADTGDGGGDGGSHETGCITLDGQGSYAWIADAVADASPGARIDLSACTGTHTETVVLDKELLLQGSAELVLTSEDDTVLTVLGAGVELQDLVIQAQDDGILVDGASGVSLTRVEILGGSGWALRTEDAEALEITALTASGAKDGGVRLDGGSTILAGSTLHDLEGYGIRALGGASLQLLSSQVRGVDTAGSTSAQDGVGVSIEDGTLEAQDLVVEDVLAWGVFGDAASLLLTRVQVTGGTMGVLASESGLEVHDSSFTDALWCGIYSFNTGETIITGTTVVGTPGVIEEIDPETWYDEAYVGTGMFLVSPSVTVQDSSVSGYGGAGMLVSADDGEALLERVTISDVGQFGVYLGGVQAQATDLSVARVASVQGGNPDRCFTVDRDVGILAIESNLAMTGGGVSGSEGYGISAVAAELTAAGVTIEGNGCSGLMGFQSAVELTGSELSEASGVDFGAALTMYQGSGLYASGNSFHDNAREFVDWSNEYGTAPVTRYDYYAWFGADIQLFYGGHATIEGNTFTRGNNGVEVLSDVSYGYSTASLTDNQFTGYEGFTVFVSEGSEATVQDLSVEDYAMYPLACVGGQMHLDGVQLVNGGTLVERYEVYEDGVLTDNVTYPTYGPALYSEGCSVDYTDVEIDDATAWGVYVYGGSAQIEQLDLVGVGSVAGVDGLVADAEGGDVVLSLDGGRFESIARYGLYTMASTKGQVNLTVQNLSVDGAGVSGIQLENSSGDRGRAGASIHSSTISGSGSTGLYSQAYDLQLDTVTVGTSRGSGIQLDGGKVGIQGSTSYDNLGYGMACLGDPTIDSCDLLVTGNSQGEFDDCTGCDAGLD